MQLGFFDAAPVRREPQISNIPLPNPSGLKARRQLRDYQQAAVAGIHGSLKDHRGTMVIMATGTGKTTVASRVVQDWPARDYATDLSSRIVVLAHREELLTQMRARPARPRRGEVVS